MKSDFLTVTYWNKIKTTQDAFEEKDRNWLIHRNRQTTQPLIQKGRMD